MIRENTSKSLSESPKRKNTDYICFDFVLHEVKDVWCVLGRHPKGCVLKDNRIRLQDFQVVYFGCRAGKIRYNCTIYIVVLSI